MTKSKKTYPVTIDGKGNVDVSFKPPYPQKPVKTYTDGGKKKVMPVHGQKWV